MMNLTTTRNIVAGLPPENAPEQRNAFSILEQMGMADTIDVIKEVNNDKKERKEGLDVWA